MKKYIFYFVLICNSFVFAQNSIGDFFNNLYEDYPEYIELRIEEYNLFCQKYSLDSQSVENQGKFFNICFLHDLFTGISAQNYESGGILKIPYFWHWIDPNPRHEIILFNNSNKLSKIKPPKEFSKYKSYADIDRTPYLYLGDLLSDEPKYYHERCSEFYTFGWCSEREMAFNTLIEIIGNKSKIKQDGIHTWSEVFVKFNCPKNETKLIIFKVDNTFDIVDYELIKKEISFEEWKKDIGQGSTIKWYNKKAHSKLEVDKVRSIKITKKASAKIKNLIDDWLRNR